MEFEARPRRAALPRVRPVRHRARERRRAPSADDAGRPAPHPPARAGHPAVRARAYDARGIRRRRLRAGDGLRRLVGTPDAVLRAPGPIGRDETLRLAPAVRRDGLRGGLRGWDGQLIDDARLVVAVARTAAGYGASHPHAGRGACACGGDGAVLRDALTGEELRDPRARRAQRDRGVGGGARPRRAPAPEPRHAPRGRDRAPGRVGCLAHRSGARIEQPLRLHRARAARAHLHRASPTCPPTGRCPRCRTRPTPRSTCSSTR